MTRVSGGLEGAGGRWEKGDLCAASGADSVVKGVRMGRHQANSRVPWFPLCCCVGGGCPLSSALQDTRSDLELPFSQLLGLRLLCTASEGVYPSGPGGQGLPRVDSQV